MKPKYGIATIEANIDTSFHGAEMQGRRVPTATLLAWFLWVLVIVCITASQLLRLQINALLLRNVTGALYLQEQIYWLVLIPALAPAYATVGAIVASRRPGNGVGWLCLALGLIVSMQEFTWNYAALALEIAPGTLPGGVLVAWLESALTFGPLLPLPLPTPPLPLLLLLLIFPNGRFLSHRWRILSWVAIVCSGLSVLLILISPTLSVGLHTEIANPTGIRGVEAILVGGKTIMYGVGLLVNLAVITSIFMRWRSTRGKEHQQLKWPAYVSIVTVVSGFIYLISSYWPVSPYIPVLIGAICIAGITIGIPVAIGIAMLRHRLYDIDVLINRTLVYGILTAILALVYFVSVFLLQLLLRGLISQTNGVVIVASTLAIVGVFQPLRSRIQNLIDRRFYRHKYNAEKTLAAFGETLRNEVDLTQLSERLVAVVEETMQPTLVSLWLCAPERYEAVKTQALPDIGN